MNDNRQEIQLYDNLLATSLVPQENIKKPDLGILKKEVKSLSPMEVSTNYGNSNSAKASFRWNYNAVKLLREAKLRGKIKITGGTGATIDGNMKALFSNVQLQKAKNAVLQQIERANRFHMTNYVAVISKENCDVNFADGSDNYYKEDNATSGSAGPLITQGGASTYAVSTIREPGKRHVTQIAQDFENLSSRSITLPS